MENIKSIAITFCVIMIIMGIVLKLAPKNKLNKNMKTVLGLVMLAILLSPLGKITFSTSAAGSFQNIPEITYSAEDYSKSIIEATVEQFRKDIEKSLTEHKIEYTDINVMYVETAGEANITGVVVFVPEDKNKKKIEKIIENEFLLKATVRIG